MMTDKARSIDSLTDEQADELFVIKFLGDPAALELVAENIDDVLIDTEGDGEAV